MTEEYWTDLLKLFLTTIVIELTIAGIVVGIAWKLGLF